MYEMKPMLSEAVARSNGGAEGVGAARATLTALSLATSAGRARSLCIVRVCAMPLDVFQRVTRKL